MERPAFVTNEHLEFLDGLRESGITHMFGAMPYLEAEFGLVSPVSREILRYWMDTFGKEQR